MIHTWNSQKILNYPKIHIEITCCKHHTTFFIYLYLNDIYCACIKINQTLVIFRVRYVRKRQNASTKITRISVLFWVDWVWNERTDSRQKFRVLRLAHINYTPNFKYLFYRIDLEISWSQEIVLWRSDKRKNQVIPTIHTFFMWLFQHTRNPYTKFQVPRPYRSEVIGKSRICLGMKI